MFSIDLQFTLLNSLIRINYISIYPPWRQAFFANLTASSSKTGLHDLSYPQDKSAHNEVKDFYAHMSLMDACRSARCFCRYSGSIAVSSIIRKQHRKACVLFDAADFYNSDVIWDNFASGFAAQSSPSTLSLKSSTIGRCCGQTFSHFLQPTHLLAGVFLSIINPYCEA